MIPPSHSIRHKYAFPSWYSDSSPVPISIFPGRISRSFLDNETLDLVLHFPDLSSQLRGIVGSDASSDDGAGDTTCASKCGFGWDVDVGYVLVFAEEGEMEEDGEWAGVCGENDDLGNTSVERLGKN